MGCCGFLFKKLIPFLLLVVALFIGYILTTPVPMGTFFSLIFSVMGLFNPEHVDVPVDMSLSPRYQDEIFFELPSGAKMPGVGLGLCCRPAAYDDESVRRMVLHFLLLGGRTLDTAHLYLNHRGVGQGVRDAVAAGIPREEIFVTTKIWPGTFGTEKTEKWVPLILEELGLDYVDLVLLHAPDLPLAFIGRTCETPKDCRQETWAALSKFVEKGVIRDIGVSNFGIEFIKELGEVSNGAPIAVNQIQFNPWATETQNALATYCLENNIVLTGYSSLGGFVNKEKALSKDAITTIAEKYGKTTSQVLLRWSLQRNVSVIPGTKSPNHMRSNLDIYTFSLSEEDMNVINNLSHDDSIYMEIL